jgi:epoxyqueuosine reductase
MSGQAPDNTEWLKRLALGEGAALFGVAALGPIRDRFLLSARESSGMEFGVSMAVALAPPVLMGIEDRPTLLYKWHYQQANNLLDKMAFILSGRIAARGHRALPVPASQIVDWETHKGHLSHRMVAEAAGLGWRGRNNLTVNATFGSAIRLVTVITDLPLSPDGPVQFLCGDCDACVKACPAGALGMNPSDYRIDICHQRLTGFSRERGIGVHICGVCVKACLHRKSRGTAG